MLDISVSRFHALTAHDLETLEEVMYVYEHATQERLVAVVPYKQYLAMQSKILRAYEAIERHLERDERETLPPL